MSLMRFELSQPKAGWMDIAVKDEDTTITFPVSYLCDPIYMLLKTFDILLTRERDCLMDKEYEWSPFPTIYFEGEGVDTYVTFGDCETIVNVIKDNVYQSHSFLMDWEDVMNDVMNQLTDANMKIYCYDWYDNPSEADEIKLLKEKVQELYTEVCQKERRRRWLKCIR